MKGYISDYTEECSSQLFGEADFPDEWLENDVFSPCEFFLCKIDLSVFGGNLLDKKGYMYIFIDMPSTIKKAKPILRFCADEPDACTDFNEGYFEEEYEAKSITEATNGVGEEVVVNEEVGSEVVLFSLGSENIPEELGIESLKIVIDKATLLKHDYSAAHLSF